MLRHKLRRHTRVSIMSKIISGKFFVAAGCSSTHRYNVSLHGFPKENRAEIRRLWINFVKTKRKDFTDTTKYSVLCEKTFYPGVLSSNQKNYGLRGKEKNVCCQTQYLQSTRQIQCRQENDQVGQHHRRSLCVPRNPPKIRAAFMIVSCIKNYFQDEFHCTQNGCLFFFLNYHKLFKCIPVYFI